MTTESLANTVWLGKYEKYQGLPCVPLISLDTDTRESFEKTFHTNFRILERVPTANQTLKIVGEFMELGGNFPPKHNLATLESFFPTADEFPHKVGDVIRVETIRKYLKCDMDSDRKAVIGLKTGEYDNHFVHKINWSSWQFIEDQPHSQKPETKPKQQEKQKQTLVDRAEVMGIKPKQQEQQAQIEAEVKIDPKSQNMQSQTDGWLEEPETDDDLFADKKIVKVKDDRQLDRDARQNNNSDQIAGNIIVNLWEAGRFPQLKAYTDIIHIGKQVEIISKAIQGDDPKALEETYKKFLQEQLGLADMMKWE
jgi:hypothetical protein